VKLKFVNKTDYMTVQVRAIVRHAIKRTHSGKVGPGNIEVHILPARKDRVTVRVNGNYTGPVKQMKGVMELRLPADPSNVDKELIACYTSWAFAMMRGLSNRDVNGTGLYDPRCDYKKAYAAVADMPVCKKTAKAKPTGAGLAFKKAAHAQDMVNKWESKLKKAETMLKKWRRKLKYHEQRGEQLQLEWAQKLQEGNA